MGLHMSEGVHTWCDARPLRQLVDYSEYLHIDDPHETTPSESLAIQYALELAETYIQLACKAISIDWVAPPWITKTSMPCHGSLRNPFNCLPSSDISQYTQRLLTKKKIYGWLYFIAYVTFGGTGDVKWICELSYLFKKQKVVHLAKFKVTLYGYLSDFNNVRVLHRWKLNFWGNCNGI